MVDSTKMWLKHSTKVIIFFISFPLMIGYLIYTREFASVTYIKWNNETAKNISEPQRILPYKINNENKNFLTKKENNPKVHFQDGNLTYKVNDEDIKKTNVNEKENHHKVHFQERNLTHKFNSGDFNKYHQKVHFQNGNLTHKYSNEVLNSSFPKEKENYHKAHFQNGNLTHEFNSKVLNTNLPKKNHRIVIMTRRRSGSSFIGELFQRNPDVFYMFEPLKPLDILNSKDTPQVIESLGFKHLRNTMRCNFDKSYVNLLMRFLKQQKTWTMKRIFPECSSYKDIKDKCAKKKNVVSKTIRIDSLEGLANNLGRNFTIILLIRDPRGIFNSRLREKKAYADLSLYEKTTDMKVLCSMNVKDLKFLSTIIEDKSAYIFPDLPSLGLILYEDFALDPMKQAKEMYNHLRMPFHENVRKWILTHTSKPKKYSAMSDSSPKYLYDTTRNSSEIANKWRLELSLKDIKIVESIPECATLIKMIATPNKLSKYWYHSR
ncbi:unnamed protein product [Owenia fusiformis]|uniref:Uncharacterized protein n=1 Tax=Owenia fusiformis TaxID=6347 RepID=A0A8J1UIY9_OWEFU|nr:unnamed protein product [Owenia fusiformis]